MIDAFETSGTSPGMDEHQSAPSGLTLKERDRQQRRKPPAKRRAFQGLAGSPLARVVELDPVPNQDPELSVIVEEMPVAEPLDEQPLTPVLENSAPTKTRAFTGLVGWPPEESAQAPATEVLQPSSEIIENVFGPQEQMAKRGPRPKTASGVPATPAERKRAQRKREQEERSGAEREKLITELMKTYRRQRSHIVRDPKRRSRVEDLMTSDRLLERNYLAQLNCLSLDELKLASESKNISDSHGRDENELSKGGAGEVEKIDAARPKEIEIGGRIITVVKPVRPEGTSLDALKHVRFAVRLSGKEAEEIDRRLRALREDARFVVWIEPEDHHTETGHFQCRVCLGPLPLDPGGIGYHILVRHPEVMQKRWRNRLGKYFGIA